MVNTALVVDKIIGSAYDVVAEVHKNLPEIRYLAYSFDALRQSVIDGTDGDISELSARFDTLSASFTTLRQSVIDDVAGDRVKLTASRTVWVTGSAGNDVVAPATGGAEFVNGFATIQAAVDWAYQKIDGGGRNGDVSIQIYPAGGPYTSFIVAGALPGGGGLHINGSGGSAIIGGASTDAITVSNGATVTLSNLALGTTGSGNGLRATTGSLVTIDAGMTFGSCASSHLDASNGATIISAANYTVSGGAVSHFHATNSGTIGVSHQVTLVGTPTFAAYFAGASLGMVQLIGATFVGGATGPKFVVHYGGIIRTVVNATESDPSRLPGSIPGIAARGGYYDDISDSRERLAANRTVWVTGSVGNDDLGAVRGAPVFNEGFATIQGAINWIQRNIDSGQQKSTLIQLHVAGGPFNAPISIAGGLPGGGLIWINGSGGQAVIGTTNANCITVASGSEVLVSNIAFSTAGSGDCLYVGTAGVIQIGDGVRFGSCAGSHMNSGTGGTIFTSVGYTITGGAVYHYLSRNGGVIGCSHSVTLQGTPAFTAAFAGTAFGMVELLGAVFTGSATGFRYRATVNGVIRTDTGNANLLPGSSAGAVATGGQYT
jgi:hypothetical protein